MSMSLKIEGAGDIERALAQFARGTAKGIGRRAMKKALQPVKASAENSAYKIAITSKLSPRQRGLARGDQTRSQVSLYVGPVQQDGSHAPEAIFTEFGTGERFHKSGKSVGSVLAAPFLRPAWDANQSVMLEILRREIWQEIEKALERARRKAASA